MKYWPQWDEYHILYGMSYDNLMMYMASIPDYEDDQPGDGQGSQPGSPPAPKTPQVTGYKTLFDL